MYNLSNPIYNGTLDDLIKSGYGKGKYMKLRGYVVEAAYGTLYEPGTQLVLAPVFNAPEPDKEVHIGGTPGVYRVLKIFEMYDGKLQSIYEPSV